MEQKERLVSRNLDNGRFNVCPVCGNSPFVTEMDDFFVASHSEECRFHASCKCLSKFVFGRTLGEIINEWNGVVG